MTNKKGRVMEEEKPKIYFEITHSDPEKTPERLALKLVEAFNDTSLFERQALDFKQQSQDERRKGQEVEIILSNLTSWKKKLKEDRENGIERKISRMEPMLSYDEDALAEQLAKNKADAAEFNKMAEEHSTKALAARRDVARLQAEIKEAHEAAKKD